MTSCAGPPLSHPNLIGDLLRRGLDTRPDEVALASASTQMPWREVARLGDQLASAYLAMGLRPGDRIASLMPNRPALVVHYLACIRAGLVATPLNYRCMPPEIDHALEVSGATLLLHHAERDQDVAASKAPRRLPMGVVRYKAADGGALRFEDLIEESHHDLAFPEISRDAPAFIFFTSGSTGKPKGVTHTRETLGCMIASAAQALAMTANDVVLPGSSLSHIGGSLFSLLTLAAGARLVIPRGSEGSEILPLLKRFRPTMIFMLPAALITLIRDHDAKTDDFATIRLCLSGGDKVSAELEREFARIAGLSVDENFGMTEIGMATLNPPSGENRIGSVGKLCPGYEASIRDESGAEVPAGVSGRLWIRSPANSIGYWNNPKATAETIVDGWLDTGDVMRVDDDEYFWFCGRKKQIIIHDGSNICPQDVEQAISEHPAIQTAGVIGVHDLVHGENVRAYVSLRAGAKRPTSEEIIRFARARVGYKAPEEIVVLDAMPLNATGKVDRVTLKRMAEERVAENTQAKGVDRQ